MTVAGWAQIVLFAVVVLALARPVGGFMTRVFAGERTFLSPVLRPVERGCYALAGVDEGQEQDWLTYALAMLAFSTVGCLVLYLLERAQGVLPLNPQGQAGMAPDLAFNTAVSFATNTNWQNYGGESTLGYLVQMVGLTVHNFVSAATGIAIAVVLIRGFARATTRSLGNFWVDLTRCTLYVLLPICLVYALFLVWQGVPQTLGAYVDATTLEGGKQTIAVGPVASQEAIKMLGTNGGGFFNANSAHPFENPTPLANFVEIVSIFVLGVGLTNVFGRMVGDERQGWAILAAMARPVPRRRHALLLGRGAGQPDPRHARRRPGHARRQHGGQGGPLRHPGLGPLRHRDDRRLLRRRQRHARQLHAAWAAWCRSSTSCWARSSSAASARASTASCCSSSSRLRRRADGRPDAGVSRQEARGQGGQDGHAGRPVPAARDARLHRARGRAAGRHLEHRQPRAARPLGDPLRLRLGRPGTTARPSPASPATRPSTT